jgi:type I restriction enzyme S subunit
VTEEKADELRNCDAIVDDLIFTAAGSLGQVGLIPKTCKYQRYIISNKQLRVRLDTDRVDPQFAFYWFSSKQMVQYIQQRNTGSSVPLINLGVLRSLPMPLPPLPEQRRIAHILGALDDKIELNGRMNETLEAMARALFKSWFVDFDPVRAKAEGRDTGLPAHIAGLFPNSFAESRLGIVPAGWLVRPLSDCCRRIFSGGTPNTQSQSYWNGALPWLSSGETRTRFITDTEKTITQRGVENSSTRLARANSTVIASAGQGHDVSIIHKSIGHRAGGGRFGCIRSVPFL